MIAYIKADQKADEIYLNFCKSINAEPEFEREFYLKSVSGEWLEMDIEKSKDNLVCVNIERGGESFDFFLRLSECSAMLLEGMTFDEFKSKLNYNEGSKAAGYRLLLEPKKRVKFI